MQKAKDITLIFFRQVTSVGYIVAEDSSLFIMTQCRKVMTFILLDDTTVPILFKHP